MLISAVVVLGGAYLVYSNLEQNTAFWDAQHIWSIGLIIGWSVNSIEYFRQGWILHHAHTSDNISLLLPATYLVMQCILFVKGIFFQDWSIIASALIVNSGVVFYLYQALQAKRKWGPRSRPR